MKLISIIKEIKANFQSIIWNFMINTVASSKLIPPILRTYIYNLVGLNIETFNISPGCFMGSSKIKIGKKTFINYNVFFDALSMIKIGENCLVAMEVMFCTSTHKIQVENGEIKIGVPYGLPITVGDNCWIGARATILPEVTIGNGCVIAAGAVVTKDCEANCLYAGIPAKKIKNY